MDVVLAGMKLGAEGIIAVMTFAAPAVVGFFAFLILVKARF